jgi:hypothetical protein
MLKKRLAAGLGVVAATVLIVVSAAGGATSDTQTYTVPFVPPVLFNPCHSEFVMLTGTMHVKVHSTVGSDGRMHVEATVSDASVKGVTLAGVRYVENSTETSTTNDSADTAPSEATVTANSNLIRLGEDGTVDDYRVRSIVHMTIDANGVPTADKSDATAYCN